MFCDLAYTVQAESVDALDRAALSAGVDFSKNPTARQHLDDALAEPVGRDAEGFEALRRYLGR